MNNLPSELQYRLAQLETCIQNQQNQSALLALEDLTRVLQQDYQQIQKAYLTLQQLHISNQAKKVDLPSFCHREKCPKPNYFPLKSQQLKPGALEITVD